MGRRVVPLSLHKRLYLDAMELRLKNGWSHTIIGAELQRRYGVRVPSSTVYYWVTKRSNPLEHWNVFELRPSKELSYVIGVVMGDGTLVAIKKDSRDEIRLQVRDKDFAEEFNEAMARVLERERPNKIMAVLREDKNNTTFYHSRYSSLQLGKILRNDLRDLKALIEGHPAEFLRGFFDSEGSATAIISKRRLQIQVIASNSDMEVLTYVQGLLNDRFGIHSSIYPGRKAGESSLIYGRLATRTKDSFFLSIQQRQSVKCFFSGIGFSINRKREVLKVGLGLIAAHGSRVAAVEWRRIYTKKGRRWVELHPHG